MKAYVKIGCIDSNRDTHKAGTVVEIDPKTDKKLFDLGLVEQYNEKKHGAAVDTLDVKFQEANTALGKANEKIAQLEEANIALAGFVEEAIGLPKGQKPDGYKKAK